MEKPFAKYRFNRMEIAGSLGDLGTLLPLAIGMIVLCGLQATNVIMMAGLFYIAAGAYFRVPIAVQPMKTIAAYALGVGLLPTQIVSAGLWRCGDHRGCRGISLTVDQELGVGVLGANNAEQA